jgi:hypothetical protein
VVIRAIVTMVGACLKSLAQAVMCGSAQQQLAARCLENAQRRPGLTGAIWGSSLRRAWVHLQHAFLWYWQIVPYHVIYRCEDRKYVLVKAVAEADGGTHCPPVTQRRTAQEMGLDEAAVQLSSGDILERK